MTAAAAAAPYRPSVVNRVFGAIERLPGGGWWVYPLLLATLIAYVHAVLWGTGRVAVGTLAPDAAAGTLYGPFGLGATHYANRVAGRAIARFRPASGLSDEDYALRRYELVTMPAGPMWGVLALGVLIALSATLLAPAPALATYGATPSEALLVLMPIALVGYPSFPIATYQTFRQLRLVARLHREATAIDPFDPGPIYAFSRLTALVGVLFVLLGYYGMTVNASFQAGNLASLAPLVASVGIGVACFILPLWGIHGRLVDAKAQLLREATARVQAVQTELYRRVDAASLTGIKEVTDAFASVTAARDGLAKLPTWPWPPQVLRGFLTAILLPVVVFLITRYLGSQIR